jgi:predicted Rossmann fold flavoprotein
MSQKKIIIVGAGASGMLAAIAAARSKANVTILEHTDRQGKKLLATGNGRCNITNIEQSPFFYRSENEGFEQSVLEQFSVTSTLQFFSELGIYTKNKNGYVYPNSDQASAVLEVLQMELERLHVPIIYNEKVEDIKRKDKQFLLHTKSHEYLCDRIVLAAGSMAAPKTGSDGSGYNLAKRLGHHIIKPLPALVQLKCTDKFFKSLAGIRCDARLDLLIDGKKKAWDRGELQLTDYGISGIPTFQISRYAVRALEAKQKVDVLIDFMPDFEEHVFETFLQKRMEYGQEKSLDQFFIGMLNKKLIPILIKRAGLSPELLVGQITKTQMQTLIDGVKHFQIHVTGSNSYEQAQVCSGGIDTREINQDTLESKKVPGMYVAGEIIDVDGICGGYNLQWAWSSGYVAGSNAAR